MQLTASPHFDTGAYGRRRAEVEARAGRSVGYVTAAGHHEPDGTPIVERRKDRARRDALLREWDRFDSLSPSEQQAYMVLGRKRERTGPPAVIRRNPAARPAARRPRRRSGASSSRAGPSDPDLPEPPAGVGGTEPRRAWRADRGGGR